jgi:hypothetical protein
MLKVPFVLLYRSVYACTPPILPSGDPTVCPFATQLKKNECARGGWYTNKEHRTVSTRESFFTIMALHNCKEDVAHIERYVHRLSEHMTSDGQVPWKFTETWSGTEVPHYTCNGKKVVDANAQFLILLEWLHGTRSQTLKLLHLHARRAYQWLETFMKNNAFYEESGSSWENTIQHSGYVLLTNVLVCQSIRSMELICMSQGEKKHQELMVKTHGHFIESLQKNLYTSQEVLPRMLAIYWNMLPVTFLKSYNQELRYPIPLITPGPCAPSTTWESWLYGTDDIHTRLVYPWIGFLWTLILFKTYKTEEAKKWWEYYGLFEKHSTLYNIYTPMNMKPVRRAFLQSCSGHSLSMAMFIAAKQFADNHANSPQ